MVDWSSKPLVLDLYKNAPANQTPNRSTELKNPAGESDLGSTSERGGEPTGADSEAEGRGRSGGGGGGEGFGRAERLERGDGTRGNKAIVARGGTVGRFLWALRAVIFCYCIP
jgi:hypothetical protein